MNLVTSTTNNDIDFWAEQEFLSDSVRESVKNADVIVAPLLNFRDGVEVSFHQGTISFFDYLRIGLQERDFTVVVCAPEDSYYEIALHSRAHRLSNIVATYVAVPLVVSLMANYIFDELKASPGDTISTSITIEQHDCKTSKIEFEGQAKDFQAVIDEVIKISESCDKESGQTKPHTENHQKQELEKKQD